VKIDNWQQKYLHVSLLRNFTAVIKMRQLSQIWLLNCFEGCQHALASKNIKIGQIAKIIVVHNSPGCINGLLGLLSTVSLSTERSRVDIYGPNSIHKYLFLGCKYSRTSFRHNLYFYNSLDDNMIEQLSTCLNYFIDPNISDRICLSLLDAERSGVFNCSYAKNYNLPPGSLYGSLKKGQSFILPDGSVVHGKHFIYGYYLGCEFTIVSHAIGKRDLGMISSVSYVVYA
jgi:ribonuclease Z